MEFICPLLNKGGYFVSRGGDILIKGNLNLILDIPGSTWRNVFDQICFPCDAYSGSHCIPRPVKGGGRTYSNGLIIFENNTELPNSAYGL